MSSEHLGIHFLWSRLPIMARAELRVSHFHVLWDVWEVWKKSRETQNIPVYCYFMYLISQFTRTFTNKFLIAFNPFFLVSVLFTFSKYSSTSPHQLRSVQWATESTSSEKYHFNMRSRWNERAENVRISSSLFTM